MGIKFLAPIKLQKKVGLVCMSYKQTHRACVHLSTSVSTKRSKWIYVIHCDKTANHSYPFICRPCSCIPTKRSLVCINYLSEHTNKPMKHTTTEPKVKPKLLYMQVGSNNSVQDKMLWRLQWNVVTGRSCALTLNHVTPVLICSPFTYVKVMAKVNCHCASHGDVWEYGGSTPFNTNIYARQP